MRRYSTNLTFVDMLFNLLIGFTSLFIIAFLLINPIADEGKIDPVTQFMLTATWDNESPIDLDVWVKGPGINGSNMNVIGFQNKDGRYMVLDRDDLGANNDSFMLNGEPMIVKRNIETVVINSIVPGEYVVNVHFFGPNREIHHNRLEEVEVTLYDMEPFTIKFTGKKSLSFREETTLVSFVVTEDGEITDVRSDIGLDKIRPEDGSVVPTAPTYSFVPEPGVGE